MVLIFGDNFVRINEEQEHFGKIWVYVFICIFSFTLSVAPEISKNPKDTTKKQGHEVTFSCSAMGNPQPIFHWTKDGVRMNAVDNPRFNVSSTSVSHSLTIKDVGQSDVGKYRCVAENSVDSSVSSAATLTVACKVLVCRLIYDRYTFRLLACLVPRRTRSNFMTILFIHTFCYKPLTTRIFIAKFRLRYISFPIWIFGRKEIQKV